MSGLYQVFIKWAPRDPSNRPLLGRYILIFPSRYEADELYREWEVIKWNNQNTYFRYLERKSPQFWLWDAIDHAENAPWNAIFNVAAGLRQQFIDTVIITKAVNPDGMQPFNITPGIPTVTGPDWFSGGKFFIRNRRQPEIYWWVHNREHVHTSTYQRTKFIIELSNPSRADADRSSAGGQPQVMIRSDDITIRTAPENPSPASSGNTDDVEPSVYLVHNDRTRRIEFVTREPSRSWKFGRLLNGDFGVKWMEGAPTCQPENPSLMIDQNIQPVVPFLAWMDNVGDEWELV